MRKMLLQARAQSLFSFCGCKKQNEWQRRSPIYIKISSFISNPSRTGRNELSSAAHHYQNHRFGFRSCSLSSSAATPPPQKEVDRELHPFLRFYKDGTIERLSGSPIVPPFLDDPETGVTAKDITISNDPLISARAYLPKLAVDHDANQKLPVLVYFHGGGFCFESAFSLTETTLLKTLVSMAKIVAVSIEYRLAPEHPLPIAYEDCWAGLQWVASHSIIDGVDNKEPWISSYVDFNKVFVGGDSAGANIVHNVLLQAGKEALRGDVKLAGAIMTHPFFSSSKPIGTEITDESDWQLANRVWECVYPSAPGGIDNPMVNPVAPGAPSLAGLGCPRLLVSVAKNDLLRDRGVLYYDAVKESGYEGEIELIEVEEESHAFHILNYETENSKNFIKRLASFLLK